MKKLYAVISLAIVAAAVVSGGVYAALLSHQDMTSITIMPDTTPGGDLTNKINFSTAEGVVDFNSSGIISATGTSTVNSSSITMAGGSVVITLGSDPSI